MHFRGSYGFMSNFRDCTVILDDMGYPSVENAFAAGKTKGDRTAFTTCTASVAKRLGRQAELRSDWETYRLQLMEHLLRQKFNIPWFRKKLASVQGPIVEDNYWHDNFWGACECPRCAGKTKHNHLGKLLELIRDEINEYKEYNENTEIADYKAYFLTHIDQLKGE